MRKFDVASSAVMKGFKAVHVKVDAKNPIDAVYEGHPRLLPEVIESVEFNTKHSTNKISYFEVKTLSGTHEVLVEEDD